MTIPCVFSCHGERLLGILHRSKKPSGVGVVIVVGGPQYRVGSHRQFVHQARVLADAGYTTLRFDYRGMGDSSGEPLDFRECGDDIFAAVDELLKQDSTVDEVVLLGLCDGASSSLMYGARHPKIGRLILLNPWVSYDAERSDAMLKHYYASKFLDWKTWKKLLTNTDAMVKAFSGFARVIRNALFKDKDAGFYREIMLKGLTEFSGKVLVVLSGKDIVAAEFEDLITSDRRWMKTMDKQGVRVVRMEEANHTFSLKRWESEIHRQILTWLGD